MRIALIHVQMISAPAFVEAFAAGWPEAELVDLLDSSLFLDRAREGGLTPRMTDRFVALARHARDAGAAGVVFTCSAFGHCIEAAQEALAPMPILKPNEAMIEAAVAAGSRIGLMATFGPTLETMPGEFPADASLRRCLVEGAFAALNAGDFATHDRLVVAASRTLEDCGVLALAQSSMARAAGAVAAATGKPVLTTPDTAVRKLRGMLGG